MLELHLPDLSCGHCARAVTDTLRGVDAQAEVKVDLPGKTVQVTTTAATERIVAALVEAGYPPA